jgi:FKBP-type peptidyl-prolyl cis-trans isomerase SlyD
MKISKTSFVTLEYLIRLGEKETYPPGNQPEQVSFPMGQGIMPPGLEQALLGLSVDDHQVVRLTPEQGYGVLDPELVMEVPRDDFPLGTEVRQGMVFETVNDEGHPVFFLVRKVDAGTVTIDFNHPLAGHELEVDFTIRGVRETTPEDLASPACSCGCQGEPHQH